MSTRHNPILIQSQVLLPRQLISYVSLTTFVHSLNCSRARLGLETEMTYLASPLFTRIIISCKEEIIIIGN